jgi:predicted nucleic-acid-binding protein
MQTYGLDTSILVRLLTCDPEADYIQTLSALEDVLDREPQSRLCVSNMVIAEAYAAVHYHYGVTKGDTRAALFDILQSGLIEPQGGRPVLDVIRAADKGAGLADRLIVNDYRNSHYVALTNDKRMAKVEGARLL